MFSPYSTSCARKSQWHSDPGKTCSCCSQLSTELRHITGLNWLMSQSYCSASWLYWRQSHRRSSKPWKIHLPHHLPAKLLFYLSAWMWTLCARSLRVLCSLRRRHCWIHGFQSIHLVTSNKALQSRPCTCQSNCKQIYASLCNCWLQTCHLHHLS